MDNTNRTDGQFSPAPLPRRIAPLLNWPIDPRPAMKDL